MNDKLPISECLVCQKPLGQETKDLDYRVCLDHRTCGACGKELNPSQVHLAQARAFEESETLTVEHLLHPRCIIANGHFASVGSDPLLSIRQSTFNILNSARLMLEPNMDLTIIGNENASLTAANEYCKNLLTGEETFDILYYHEKKLEA